MNRPQRTKRRQVSPVVAAIVIVAACVGIFLAFWLGTRGPETKSAAQTEGFKKVQADLYKELRAHPEQMRRGGGRGMPGIARRGPMGIPGRTPGR